ncbi:chondroitinase-B domain-containing protein [Haloferula sp. BvORR071]|uniref:chondroitinase-B domain-containing protein n=1 Tax=Haloferula sp. BvORR071 TaxID=1396141 RepID=UPI0009DF00FE|nr:chondroitinase-B domain-containing protein [Haloferula sp. BvORR071]
MFSRLSLVLSAILAPSAFATEHTISSAVELARLSDSLAPGDVVIISDGTWKDQRLAFTAKGTEAQPITLRAATPGKVILEGGSALKVDGEHLLVDGLWFKDASTDANAIEVRGSDCRITNCAVSGGQHRNFLRLWGLRHRIDHCAFSGKTTDNPTVQIEVEEKPNHHQLDHNYFGPRPPLGRNGGETIRIGYSHQSMSSSATVMENNLFERCDGEIEIISNKSCDNIYRGNTFRDCAGMLTLRHGNRCRVEGNFFFGNLKRGSGGIRIIGEDHVVVNNYIDSVCNGSFWITAGIPDSPLVGYFTARNATIAFNTVVASPGTAIDLEAGMGSSGRSLRPDNASIIGNVFSLPPGAELSKGTEGSGFRWSGNFSNLPDEHVTEAELMLSRSGDGMWRPLPASSLRAAVDRLATVTMDADGQARAARTDAGCDQFSAEPVKSHPLSRDETGPEWMRQASASFGLTELIAHDRARILAAAEAALKLEPLTITKLPAKLSEGGPNDFYSNGDYWWPDPSKPNGLPYIKRDGETNPENFTGHRDAVRELRDAVAALGAAWLATHDERFPKKAAELLRIFLLDPATRMNPHLNYAQAIPGVSPGRGIGIIDTLHLIEIPKAVAAMHGSAAFNQELEAGLKGWFRDYLKWMLESKNGQEEAATKNNHAVAFWLQVAVFAEFTGDERALADCRKRFKESFLAKQMAGDGSFPQELARTKPYAYSIFQLDNMATLCQVLSTPTDDLWSFTRGDGKGIKEAAAYLYPFLKDKSRWPLKPDVQAWDGWPARQPCLLFAGLALKNADYLALWKSLKPDPQDAEVRRNIAITQPVLWVLP